MLLKIFSCIYVFGKISIPVSCPFLPDLFPLLYIEFTHNIAYLPATQETWLWSLSQEDPLEKGMATHSSIRAWRILWTEKPGGLQSMSPQRFGHDWATNTFTCHFHALEKETATHSSVLAWRIPGTGEPGGLPSMGSHRVGHDWSDLAAAAAACLKFKTTTV